MNQSAHAEIAPASTLLSRIEQKRHAVARASALRAKLDGLKNKQGTLSRTFRESKNALKGQELTLENGGARYPDTEKKVAMLRDDVRRLEADATLVAAEIEATASELKALEEVVIPGCMCAATIEDAMPHQNRLEALRADAARIESAISKQREAIRDAESAIVPAPDRSALRAKVLAEVAMGETGEQTLIDLDALIASEQQAHAASLGKVNPTIEQARQTIAGLDGRLVNIQADLTRAASFTPEVIERLLLSEIYLACNAFVSQMLAGQEQFRGIGALENLLNRYAIHGAAAVGGRYVVIDRNIVLPLPKDAEFDRLRMRGHPESLFRSMGDVAFDVTDFERAAIERLRGAGCTLLD
ncbi:MAG: hypothetical protein IPG66_16875 [Hydrogenophilales bacterium]|nr:hypothetical protein [Hydrogenophilales bacterium]